MTFRDGLCFLLLGTLAPALWLGATRSPGWLVVWLALWIFTTITPRNPR